MRELFCVDPADKYWGWVLSLGPVVLEVDMPGMRSTSVRLELSRRP